MNLSNFYKYEIPSENFSIKLVIPSGCNANCPFCFNKQTTDTAQKNWKVFKENVKNSLEELLNNLEKSGRNVISLDITGNEPTFNPSILKETIDLLRPYKNRFNKIVLTSNGFRLLECAPFLAEFVDYVNISVHRFNYKSRQKSFGIKKVKTNLEYIEINDILAKYNILTTAVSVIFEPFPYDFKTYTENFVKWAKKVGFSSIRFRSDFCKDDQFVTDYFRDTNFDNVTFIQDRKALYIKVLDFNGFEVRLLKGIPDLTDEVIGVEAVIDDNGVGYLDYNKRYPIKDFYNDLKFIWVNCLGGGAV